jgi:hypothetical protein
MTGVGADATSPPNHHMPTAAAAAVAAAIVAVVTHEMLGHGLGCLLGGGVPVGWSTSWSLCRGLGVDVVRNVPFQLGGNALNLLAGAAALALSRRVSRGVDAWFLWCLGALQLCGAGAYLLFDPLTGLGDFTPALGAVAPRTVVAVAVTALGALVLAAGVPTAARGLEAFVAPEAARRDAWRLVLLPWLVGGVAVLCVTAWVWASRGPRFLPAALWFDGVCTGIVMLIPLFLRPEDARGRRTIDANPVYLAVAGILTVLTYLRLGAGVAHPWAMLVGSGAG